MTRIRIELEMPEPHAPSTNEDACAIPLEDKVRGMLERVESGYKSDVTWIALNKLYSKLQEMKSNERIENLKEMIEPVLSKFGYHKVPARK